MRLVDADAQLEWLNMLSHEVRADEKLVELDKVRDIVTGSPTIAVPQWISVEDRLPEIKGRYLVAVKRMARSGSYVALVRWSKNLQAMDKYEFPGKDRPGWWMGDSDGFWEVTNVTHWMPLPEQPKEDDT